MFKIYNNYKALKSCFDCI